MERRHSLVVAHTCFFNIIIIILGFFFFFLAEVSPPPLANAFLFNKHASCKSDEYCPAGWSVKRRPEDYAAVTCKPTAPPGSPHKCPKPYMCVAAKCGINFCCVSDKMLDKVREKESTERDTAEVEREDREEREAEAEKAKEKEKDKENAKENEKQSDSSNKNRSEKSSDL